MHASLYDNYNYLKRMRFNWNRSQGSSQASRGIPRGHTSRAYLQCSFVINIYAESYALIVEFTAMASEASQVPALEDTLQSVGDMQKVPEVLTAVPEVETVSQEAGTTVGRSEPKISEDIDQQPLQGLGEDICKEAEEEKDTREMEFVKKPGEFTTEVFKIEIRNLPRYSGYKVR